MSGPSDFPGGINPGTPVVVEVTPARALGEKKGRRKEGQVVAVGRRHLVVDYGRYRESYTFADLASGRVRIYCR